MMKRLLLVLFAFAALTAAAQTQDKLAPSTRLFLSQYEGQLTPAEGTPPASLNGARRAKARQPRKARERVVQASRVNGVDMVDAFIGLDGSASVAQLQALGVVIQRQFKGFVTASIPVDKISEVAALASVKRIEVARIMQVMTDSARSATNVDKVIDGINNNLPQNYDGTGVVVGVIDTGIDPQHSAYDDANGNSRIKRLYQVTASSSNYGSSTSYRQHFYKDPAVITTLNADTQDESHGTHTSTTATGKRMSTSYGDFCGIAPNCDIYLCGLAQLSDTYIANSLSYITSYADSVGKPCVVSISLGGISGPHDGSDFLSQAYDQCTGTGKIIVLATANQAGNDMYCYKQGATKSSPLTTLYEQQVFSDVGRGGLFYYSGQASAWARTASVPLAAHLYVVNASTGSIVWDSGEITEDDMGSNGYKLFDASSSYYSSSSSLGNYYSPYSSVGSQGYAYVMIDQDANSKKYSVIFGTSNLFSRSYNSSTYASNYKLAFSVYPRSTGASTDIDMWEGGYYGNFESGTRVGSYTAAQGSDKCSASSECYASNVITIGAYVSKNRLRDANGGSYNTGNTVGQIAAFSSYVEDGYGPAHAHTIPWITAPGQTVVAGVNHQDSENYPTSWSDDPGEYRYITRSDATSYYGSMSGTSMATPVAAGIVALWLQANPKLTPDGVRQIMKESAIHDSYTRGTYASHFGNGKINALGGFETGPAIAVDSTALNLTAYVGTPVARQLVVRGSSLTGSVTLSLTGDSAFSVEPATLTAAQAAAGDTVVVRFAPSQVGTSRATLTLASPGAATRTVALTGTARLLKLTPVLLPADSAHIGLNQFRAQWTDSTPASNVESYTLLVNQYVKAPAKLVLSQNFSSFTQSNTRIDTQMAGNGLRNWTGSYVYRGDGTLLIGRRSTFSRYNGQLNSPYLAAPANADRTLTVVCTASATYRATTLRTTVGDGNDWQDSQTQAVTTTPTQYVQVFTIPAAVDSLQVKFQTTQSGYPIAFSSIQIYDGELDSVPASAPARVIAQTGDSTQREITGITSPYYDVTGLSAGGTFDYKVKTVFTDGTESPWSDTRRVTLFQNANLLDVNEDGVINANDVSTLAAYVLGQNPQPCNLLAADANHDGTINSNDVSTLISYILGTAQ